MVDQCGAIVNINQFMALREVFLCNVFKAGDFRRWASARGQKLARAKSRRFGETGESKAFFAKRDARVIAVCATNPIRVDADGFAKTNPTAGSERPLPWPLGEFEDRKPMAPIAKTWRNGRTKSVFCETRFASEAVLRNEPNSLGRQRFGKNKPSCWFERR
jgi:hypothetical protein